MAIHFLFGLSAWRRSWLTVSVALVLVVAACHAGLGGSDSASKPGTSSPVSTVPSGAGSDPQVAPTQRSRSDADSAAARPEPSGDGAKIRSEPAAAPTRVASPSPDSTAAPARREPPTANAPRAAGIDRSFVLEHTPGQCDVYGRRGDEERREYRRMDSAPVWGPDGRWIIFGGGPSGVYGPNLYLVTTDGTQLRRIVREPEVSYVRDSRYWLELITSLDLTEDGTRLLYATCKTLIPESAIRGYAGGRDLYEISLVRLDLGTHTRLREGNFPVWSPDGTRIAFVAGRGSGAGRGGLAQSVVYTMAADGSDVQRVWAPRAPLSGSADFPPRWSPDGTRLAFSVSEDDGYAIYTVNADGTGSRRLTDAASNPSWSPDGARLAFVKEDSQGAGLYTLAVDGTGPRRIRRDVRFRGRAGGSNVFARWIPSVAWSPDGFRILYSSACVADLVREQPDRLPGQGYVPPNSSIADPCTGFLGNPKPAAAWSPDGTRFAIYNGAHPRTVRVAGYSGDDVVLGIQGRDWLSRTWVLVRDRDGFTAEHAQHGPTAPVATRADCSAGVVASSLAGLIRDCEVLVDLREALLGPTATNWMAQVPVHQWRGVLVADSPRRVTEIILGSGAIGSFGHRGRLPPGLAELEELRRLDLSGNRFVGSIPAAWGALQHLQALDLSGNELTGAIPPELGQLADLEDLRLSGNELTGCIPADLKSTNHDLGDLGLPRCETAT